MLCDHHHRGVTELSLDLKDSPCPLAVHSQLLVTSDLHLPVCICLFVCLSLQERGTEPWAVQILSVLPQNHNPAQVLPLSTSLSWTLGLSGNNSIRPVVWLPASVFLKLIYVAEHVDALSLFMTE